MSKAAIKKVVEEVKVIDVPSTPAYCENCKYSEMYNNRLLCKVPLPPGISRTGQMPFVNLTYTCPLHTR